ncbi:MAG: hypothetical protein WC184_12800 [Acidimicrobiia bacterium]
MLVYVTQDTQSLLDEISDPVPNHMLPNTGPTKPHNFWGTDKTSEPAATRASLAVLVGNIPHRNELLPAATAVLIGPYTTPLDQLTHNPTLLNVLAETAWAMAKVLYTAGLTPTFVADADRLAYRTGGWGLTLANYLRGPHPEPFSNLQNTTGANTNELCEALIWFCDSTCDEIAVATNTTRRAIVGVCWGERNHPTQPEPTITTTPIPYLLGERLEVLIGPIRNRNQLQTLYEYVTISGTKPSQNQQFLTNPHQLNTLTKLAARLAQTLHETETPSSYAQQDVWNTQLFNALNHTPTFGDLAVQIKTTADVVLEELVWFCETSCEDLTNNLDISPQELSQYCWGYTNKPPTSTYQTHEPALNN